MLPDITSNTWAKKNIFIIFYNDKKYYNIWLGDVIVEASGTLVAAAVAAAAAGAAAGGAARGAVPMLAVAVAARGARID
ncbi:MAG: hypothetical protein ACK55Z_07855, partial [bacterium]